MTVPGMMVGPAAAAGSRAATKRRVGYRTTSLILSSMMLSRLSARLHHRDSTTVCFCYCIVWRISVISVKASVELDSGHVARACLSVVSHTRQTEHTATC